MSIIVSANNLFGIPVQVTDGQVARADVSVIRNEPPWSGGHEFKSELGRTWGAKYLILSLLYLNQKYNVTKYLNSYISMYLQTVQSWK